MATFHVPEKKFNPLDPARTVHMRGEINGKMVNEVGIEIRRLQLASPLPITLLIDSPGGEIKALKQILRIMGMEIDGKRWAFVTVAGRQAGSAAASLLALGDYITQRQKLWMSRRLHAEESTAIRRTQAGGIGRG